MIKDGIRGTMLPVEQGYLRCPSCGARNIQRVLPETRADNLQVYCRRCKRELIVNIRQGQCYLSQGQ